MRMRRISMFSLALVLASCGRSREPIVLTLDYAPSASPSAAPVRIAAFRVGAVHLPPSYDRPQLVRQREANRLIVDEYAHWGAPVEQVASRTLASDLSARMPSVTVRRPDEPIDPRLPVLTVDVHSIVERDGSMAVDASWVMTGPGGVAGGHPLPLDRQLSFAIALDGAGASAVAGALSRALGVIADDVARDAELRNPVGPPSRR